MTDTKAAPLGAQRTTPYAWVVLGMLGFIYIFNFLDRQLMSVLIESIKNDPAFAKTLPDGTTVGLSDADMGWMTGFWFALVYTVLGVVVGFMADRTSRRNILYAGATLWSAFTALCGFAQSYPVLLAARMGVGIGEAAGAPPSYSIISDYFPSEKRGLALAIFSMGVPLKATRKAARSPYAARATWLSGFLMAWASSSTTVSHSFAPSTSASRRSSA